MDAIENLVQAAYSFIRGVESNRSVSSLTLDHLLQQHIDAIRGGDTRVLLDARGTGHARSSKLAQLDSIQAGIDQVVQAVKDAGTDSTKLQELGLYVPEQP